MNVFQESKAIDYSIYFLSSEIISLKETIEKMEPDIIKTQLEGRLKELESDLEMFRELQSEYERFTV